MKLSSIYNIALAGLFVLGLTACEDFLDQEPDERVTVQNIEVVKVDAERSLLLVHGAVPGPKGSLVFIKNTVKKLKRSQLLRNAVNNEL